MSGRSTGGLASRLRTSHGTSGPQASHDPGFTAARRVRLGADGGGLENR